MAKAGTRIDRRGVLTAGAAGVAAASAVAAPAIAQSAPTLRWRLTSSYPSTLEALFGTCAVFVKAVAEMTDQKFQIQVFAPGEIVGGLQAADAVADGTVEACQSASYYYWGKDPTFALGTAVPFGLNARMQNAWMYRGGGIDMLNAFYARYNLFGLPGGNSGGQMGGWYRREINTPQDWRGLKIRIGGFGGSILAKLGAVPQQIAGSDVYSALEKGTIDAAEWTSPADDEKLGLQRVARYYYYPGWWEGQAVLHFFFNLQKWNELPKSYQAILRAASHMANEMMLATYDQLNPPALRRLVADGAVLKVFSEEVLDACFRASNEVYAELCTKNADFKRIYDSMMAVRADMNLMLQISEYTYDTYMMIQQRKGTL
jgi:TRAP-type mannitol/chloroaromatic compound transport system substrate-binding protein